MPNNVTAEAIKWWNKHVCILSEYDRPPHKPVPYASSCVFTKIIPLISVEVNSHLPDRQYWTEIKHLLSSFLLRDDVPDPISDFYGFLTFIYKNKCLLSPENEEQCIKFFSFVSLKYGEFAIIDKAPLYIVDPCVYLKALVLLKTSYQSYWSSVVSGFNELDTLYGLYSSFLVIGDNTNDEEAWNFRVSVIELMSHLTIESLSYHPRVNTYESRFLNSVLDILGSATDLHSLAISRIVCYFLKRVKNLLTPDLCDQLVTTVYQKELSFNYIMYFFIANFRMYKPVKIFKNIVDLGIRFYTDIELFYRISKLCVPSRVILSLAKFMITNKVYHRLCVHYIILIIKDNPSNKKVKDIIYKVIDYLFLFVSLSVLRCKFEQRSMVIYESLSCIMNSSLPDIEKHIRIMASSAWATGSTPPYFENFFSVGNEIDENFQVLFQESQYNVTDLKYFPFKYDKPVFANFLSGKSSRGTSPKMNATIKYQAIADSIAAPKEKKLKKGKKNKKLKKKKTKTPKTIG